MLTLLLSPSCSHTLAGRVLGLIQLTYDLGLVTASQLPLNKEALLFQAAFAKF